MRRKISFLIITLIFTQWLTAGPEVILNFATNLNFLGFKARMLGLAFAHQSNGRAIPLSRSWNRVIGHIGLERKNLSVIQRGWYRLKDEVDENPKITDCIGRGDLQVIYFRKRNKFSLKGSHSLQFSDDNHGQLQFDWSFPVHKNLKGHFIIRNNWTITANQAKKAMMIVIVFRIFFLTQLRVYLNFLHRVRWKHQSCSKLTVTSPEPSAAASPSALSTRPSFV